MPWVDIGICVVLLVFAIIGYFRGFLKTLVAFCGTLVTFVVAIFLAKLVGGLLETWFGFNSGLAGWIFPTIQEECSDGVISGFMLIFAQILIAKQYNINDPSVVSSAEFQNAFALELGNIAGMVITVVVLFVLLRIAIFFLSKLFDKITANKVVGRVDKFLGFVVGVLKGAFSICMLFGLVYMLSPIITPFGDLVLSLKDANPVFNQVYAWACDLMDKVIIPWFGR